METVVISGEERSEIGTKYAKEVRSEGKVPCVVYGKEGVSHFSVKPLDVRSIVYTADFKLVEIDLGGSKKKAILKDIQFHPVTDEIVHIDFLELYDGHPVKVELPVKYKGESVGVKAGGRLVSQLRSVKVKATPENLIDKLTIDISELKMGDAVRVKQIESVEGIEILAPENSPVATVEVPRALKSAAAKGEGEEEDEA